MTMCFPDCTAMSMLPLFLIQFVLQSLVYGTNAECAIGDVNKNTKWINSNGHLKYYDRDDNLVIENDYFRFQATCSEKPDYDDIEELCNCTFTKSKLQ